MEVEIYEAGELKNKLPELAEKARACLIVTDQASFERAASFKIDLSTWRKKWLDKIGPVVTSTHGAWKKATDLREEIDAPLAKMERQIGEAMGVYTSEQRRLRQVQEARLQAEARRREEDARLEQAEALEDAGDKEAAQQVIEEPIATAPVHLPEPKADGTTMVTYWSAEVVNLTELVKAVAAGKAEITLVEANQTALNGMARALKSAMSVPGVRAVPKELPKRT